MAANLAYILSASHSGSTLLAMLLGAHPEACTVGELKATSLGDPDQYRCSCGSLIRQCGFWTRVAQGMAQKGIEDFDITRAGTSIYGVECPYARRLVSPLQRGPGLEALRDLALCLSPAWNTHLRETQKRNAALVAVLRELTGAKVVVDSSKLALRLKYLLQNRDLEIKVIRLIRDGRAVSLTYTDEWSFADASNPALRGGGSGARHKPPRRNMADAAREWRRSNEAADCLTSRLSQNQWLEIRYEAVCSDPDATLRQVTEFLGLSPDKVNLNFRAEAQHVMGNGMRFDSSSEIRLDERWRTHLSQEDLATFDRIAGKLNRKYGYV